MYYVKKVLSSKKLILVSTYSIYTNINLIYLYATFKYKHYTQVCLLTYVLFIVFDELTL